VVAGLAYAVAGTLIGAALGTWTDEEYTLATTAHGVAYAIERALTYEDQAPLYFGLEAAWRTLNGAVWFARAFSVLCATGAFLLLAQIGRRISPRTNPLFFASLAALNPFVVRAAFDIRVYALALLCSAALWLCFEDGFAHGSSTRARVGFVIAAVTGIYVQYFVAFTLLGGFCALAVLGRRRALAPYLAAVTIVLIAIVPLALVAKTQAAAYATQALPLGRILIATLVHPWLDMLFPFAGEWYALPFVRGCYTLTVLLCLGIAAASRPRAGRDALAWLAAALAIELSYVALAALLRVYLAPDYFVALYVPLAAAAYALAATKTPGRPGALPALVLCVLLTAGTLASNYRHLAQPGDWARVAAYLDARAAANDVIAVFPPDALPALARQYDDEAAILPYPRALPLTRYAVSALSVASIADAERAFAPLRRYRRVWFVRERCDPIAPQFGCNYLGAAMQASFQTDGEQNFYGSDVFELSARIERPSFQGTAESLAQPRRHVRGAWNQHRPQPKTRQPQEHAGFDGVRQQICERVGECAAQDAERVDRHQRDDGADGERRAFDAEQQAGTSGAHRDEIRQQTVGAVHDHAR